MPDDNIGHPLLTLDGSIPVTDNFVIFARIEERLSTITKTRLVFATRQDGLALDTFLGTALALNLETQEGNTRSFSGTIVAAEYLGLAGGYQLFGVDIRPWLWFLTRTSKSRIFQDMSIPEIVMEVCKLDGFDSFRDRLNGHYPKRENVFQYDETDFAFISRLMEEEGIAYYFQYKDKEQTLVLADDLQGYDPIEETPELELMPQEDRARRHLPRMYEWQDRQRVVSGRVSLMDYEFTTPKTRLESTSSIVNGNYQHNDLELYGLGGHYSKVGDGEGYARVRMEREAQEFIRWSGAGNARTLAAGCTFTLKDETDDKPRTPDDKEFLIVSAMHHLQIDRANPAAAELAERLVASGEMPDHLDLYRCDLQAMRKKDPFRPPAVTPWPDLSGVHTATVTGPEGEEIYTDAHGRIKVRFHWDRDDKDIESAKKKDNTSCWLRVATPWAGKNWGMVHIPRIGQEVVVQFERNTPDRPLCIGMLYNSANPPPWGLPDNMTQSGIKTDSSKGGGGANELMMDDKKGEELVRFVAEKNYEQTVKNNADIKIGLDKADPGTLTEHVNGDVTETYDAKHTYTLKKDLTEVVTEGNVSRTIKQGNNSLTVSSGKETVSIQGNQDITIKQGDQSTTLDMGSQSTTLKMGDIDVKCSLGKITMEAMQSIELKVGSSSVKIDQMGVTVKGLMINIEGTAMLEAKAPMSTVKGDGLLFVKGGVVMIN